MTIQSLRMKKIITMLFFILFCSSVSAGYNANVVGKVTAVVTYTHTSQILINVEGQPTTHPECRQLDYMVVDPATSDHIRQIVLSRLLAAHASGEKVSIGYDKDSSCANDRIKIYRVG